MARRRGRPTRCTSEITERICREVRAGLPLDLAAALFGVRKRLVLSWVQRGERDEPDFVGFATEYRRSRAFFAKALHAILIRVLTGQSDDQGAAAVAMWELARRYPEHWGAQRERLPLIEYACDTEVPEHSHDLHGVILVERVMAARAAIGRAFGRTFEQSPGPDVA